VRWAGTGESLPYPIEHPAATLKEALSMSFPDVHDPSLWADAREEAEVARGRSLVIARQVCALYERLWALVGMETALVGLATEAGLVSALLERIADWQIAAADHFIAIGVDAARISDDYGTQNNLVMSPDTWRQIIQPHLTRLVARYREADIPVILHSCGNLARIMDDLIGVGFAAFNIQANANDLVELRERYGRRFCVWGGVSTQSVLAGGTPDQVRVAVRQAIESLGQQGGLILEPDQTVRIPVQNLRAFYEAAREVSPAEMERRAMD
jgi:uroporphyrinogen decarboxylase